MITERSLQEFIASFADELRRMQYPVSNISRDTVLKNMFDFQQVRCIAENLEMSELVQFLDEHTDEYATFSLTEKS